MGEQRKSLSANDVSKHLPLRPVACAVLIEPLPYKDPSRLAVVWQELRARGVQEFPFPPGDIPDLREKGTLFEDVAVVQTGRQSLATQSDQPEQIRLSLIHI